MTVLVSADGSSAEDSYPQDTQPLLDEWRQLGLRVVLSAWQTAEPPLTAALPLGAWDYYDVHAQFVGKMRELRAAGTVPSADLEAVSWCSHKSYLLELAKEGFPTVPTRMLQRGCDSAAALATAIEQLGAPEYCVVKPVIGGRGDGVERLRTCEGTPLWLSQLVRTCGLLVQPFLPEVTRLGEICLVFINGELLHAVRKDPQGWGAAEGDAHDRGSGALPAVPDTGLMEHGCTRQSVHVLDAPPHELVALAQRVMRYVEQRCGGVPYLARVDLLPAGQKRGTVEAAPEPSSRAGDDNSWIAGWQWLVSELELGWPELFLRASPGAARRTAVALLQHLPPLPQSELEQNQSAPSSENDDSHAAKRPKRDGVTTASG